MARTRSKSDEVPWWVWPLLVVGGVGTAAVLIDAMPKAAPTYSCWNCKGPLTLYQSPCPRCGETNVWKSRGGTS